MKFSLDVIDNDIFYNEVCQGISKSKINNEIKIIDDSLSLSPRLFLRSIDIFDTDFDLWYEMYLRTKSKRIKKKYLKKMNARIGDYFSSFSAEIY